MAANTNPIFPAAINTNVVSLTESDALSDLFFDSPPLSGTRVDKILVFSNDPVNSHDIKLLLAVNNNGETDVYTIGTFTIPANAGVLTVPPVNLLDGPLGDADGRMNIGSTSYVTRKLFLGVEATEALPPGIVLTFLTMAGDY